MIDDWTMKAARQIHLLFDLNQIAPQDTSVPRLAAVIATHAEMLMSLLRESRREHHHCDDTWYCCKKCSHDCFGELPSAYGRKGEIVLGALCTCGADEWNARVDAALGI